MSILCDVSCAEQVQFGTKLLKKREDTHGATEHTKIIAAVLGDLSLLEKLREEEIEARRLKGLPPPDRLLFSTEASAHTQSFACL